MKDKKLVQAIVVILAIVVIVVAIYFGMTKANEYQRIKETNIKMYKNLNCVSSCNVIVSADIFNQIESSIFDEGCLKICAKYIEDLEFKPGELKGGVLIFESSEYNSCLLTLNLQGVSKYKDCLIEILPKLREKYPEVIQEKL